MGWNDQELLNKIMRRKELDPLNRRALCASVKKTANQKRISADIEKYLKAGNKINHIPPMFTRVENALR